MKILITGSNGLLGQKIVAQAIKHTIPFLATSIGENRNSNCPEQNYCAMDNTNRNEVMKETYEKLKKKNERKALKEKNNG